MLDPLNRLSISPKILRVISEIDQCKGRWAASAAVRGPTTEALRHQASVSAIAASLRFDGHQVGDGEVSRVLSSLGSRDHLSPLEQDIWGYANALARVDETWTQQVLSQELVRGLHGLLFVDVSDPGLGSGRYRHEPTPEGRSVHPSFFAHTDGSIPQQMTAWVRWTNHHLEEGQHHPLLVIAAATRELLRIRPFAQGTGRVARLVTTFLMLRAGYGYARHSAIEAAVEKVLDQGLRTADIHTEGTRKVSTGEMGAAVAEALANG